MAAQAETPSCIDVLARLLSNQRTLLFIHLVHLSVLRFEEVISDSTAFYKTSLLKVVRALTTNSLDSRPSSLLRLFRCITLT